MSFRAGLSSEGISLRIEIATCRSLSRAFVWREIATLLSLLAMTGKNGSRSDEKEKGQSAMRLPAVLIWCNASRIVDKEQL